MTVIGEQLVDTLANWTRCPGANWGSRTSAAPPTSSPARWSRWRKQYERYRHRELPDFDLVAEWLERNRPADGEPAILHGDFHVDNCL